MTLKNYIVNSDLVRAMVLLKGNVTHARNFIAINECLLSTYQARILCLDFRLLEIKTDAAKESSATEYKYIDRSFSKQVFFADQAKILILCSYKYLSSVFLKSQVEFESRAELRDKQGLLFICDGAFKQYRTSLAFPINYLTCKIMN